MGKLLDAFKSNKELTENITTMIRKGKSVSIMRDSGGRFSRSGGSIGNREKQALQKSQSSESEKKQNKERMKRNTRKNTIASRERAQVSSIRTDDNFKRKDSGLLGSLKSNMKGTVRKYKNVQLTAKNLVRDLYRSNGVSMPDEMQRKKSKMNKALQILKKLHSGVIPRKGRKR